MGYFKNRTDLQTIREAGRIAGEICNELIQRCQPGLSTLALEEEANRLLQQHRSTAPFKQFDGFGYATCISLNAEIVNGPPGRNLILQPHDLVSIAIGSCYRGLHGKAARTTFLGEPSADINRLLKGTSEITRVVSALDPSHLTLRAIAQQFDQVAGRHQLTLIKGCGGCGIGKQLHEAPWIPATPDALEQDQLLPPGFAFMLMSMMSLGQSPDWIVMEDSWTQVTVDNRLSAHVADTFLVTAEGIEVLTKPYSCS